MYHRFTKVSGDRSYRNGYSDSYINSYMNILNKAELTFSALKSGTSIYNSKVLDTVGRKIATTKKH